MAEEIQEVRSVDRIVEGVETLEGEGFLVRRPFPTPGLSEFDPFLLLDEMGPQDLAPGAAKGAPDHPHRGFETVTYLLAGRMEHKDSQGHSGKLTPGDVQWMTAGAGVVHSEMPEREFARSGGRLHGFQLWVNLPREDKLMKPRYQEIPAERIPTARSTDNLVSVRVIAGEALGARASVETRTPIIYLHFTLQPGGRITHRVPDGFNAFAYIIEGEGRFGSEEKMAGRGQMVMFAPVGDAVLITAPENAGSQLDVLLIAGASLGEPIARYGPFVMNTREEIYQAIEDYRSGRMGAITF
ncbi:MAG TPA: pirin family protein [Pyrinomonadaceae bacterium]|jgi:redox-sensitive bicupin YhaK (pirin superfamily)